MKNYKTTDIVAFSLLGLAAGASFILPGSLEPARSLAATAPPVIRLNGVVRDFRGTHPDFDASVGEGSGHVVGLTDYELDENGVPSFSGTGNRVLTEAKNSSGYNIAPVLANAGAAKGVSFTISNGKVIPSEAFIARLTVLGAAMDNPTAQMRVTVRLKVGAVTIDPFGSFTNSSAGNVHDNNNPRNYVMATPMAAGTAMSVTGRSWGLYSGTWTQFYNVDSATGATGPGPTGPSCGTGMVKVLRNGDTVPNIPPFGSQSTIESYLQQYINAATKKVTIADNQAIFLFELATTNPSDSYYDYQDLVTLITMAAGPEAFQPGYNSDVPTCGPTNDAEAILDPTVCKAGVTNSDSFKEWFNDTLGSNMTGPRSLDLVRQSNDTYLFDDKLDPHYSKLGGFYPCDGRLMGDQDSSGHNENFTYQFEAMFTYSALTNQFFEAMADAEVWVFIDDELVIDLGGFHGAINQRVDLSRLCLNEGQEYKLSFFLASRYAPQSSLRISTNIEFVGAEWVSASALGD
jgi:fibro-slime domain-containing protein